MYLRFLILGCPTVDLLIFYSIKHNDKKVIVKPAGNRF